MQGSPSFQYLHRFPTHLDKVKRPDGWAHGLDLVRLLGFEQPGLQNCGVSNDDQSWRVANLHASALATGRRHRNKLGGKYARDRWHRRDYSISRCRRTSLHHQKFMLAVCDTVWRRIRRCVACLTAARRRSLEVKWDEPGRRSGRMRKLGRI